MAGVTPKQVYQALIGAGASTLQAIGIMANAINESGLNPESVNPNDPNGGSYGLIQQNGSQYRSLVTGNPPADLKPWQPHPWATSEEEGNGKRA